MKINVLSSDNYFSIAIHSFFEQAEESLLYQSIVFIDVMNLPTLNNHYEKYVINADCLILIVNKLNNYLLMHDEIFDNLKFDVAMQCIDKLSPLSEFGELLNNEIKFRKIKRKSKSAFSASELSFISSVKYGIPIKQNPMYKNTSKKVLSSWKRSVMKKLDINSDINLYLIIIKCRILTDWFHSISY
uniref:hypothetical protein n=1 Tax=Hafnia alvei TaxID=569 RepID=UPI0026EF2F63|nr:hypothetical protein [Hafnia alvei]